MYRNRVRTFFEYTAAPAVFIAIFLTLCLLLSFSNLLNNPSLLIAALVIIATVVFVFALITRILLESSEHSIRAHSKYTYIEVGLKDVIVSLYAGSFVQSGEKVVQREILVIPLSEFTGAKVVGYGKYKQISLKCKSDAIRRYVGNSDRLGYFFKEGKLEFVEFFYQEAGFKKCSRVKLPRLFGKTNSVVQIVRSIYAAKAVFDNLPPPEPYVFREARFVRERKKLEKDLKRRGF